MDGVDAAVAGNPHKRYRLWVRIFRRDLLDGIDLQVKGAMISAELMAQLAGRGAKICQVEVRHLPRLAGEQSGASFKVIARAFRELFLLYGRLRRARRNGETTRVER